MPPALAAAAPAIISAVGAAGSAYMSKRQADQAGGGGGGGGVSPLNPNFNILKDLFGVKSGVHGHGADAGQMYFTNNKRNPGLFKGQDFKQSINDLMYNSPGLFGGEQSVLDQVTGQGYADSLLGSTTSGLDQLLASNGGYQTGFRTDANPIFNEANRNFQANMLPSIAEMIGSQVGLKSQSFVDAASREGANLMGQAALKNVDLQEAAAGRIPMAAQLLQARGALPFAFSNDLMNLGNNYRATQKDIMSMPLQVFQALSGMGGPGQQGFLQQGYNPQGGGQAQLLSGLAQNAGSFAEAIGKMFPQGGGGGGGTTTPSPTIYT